MPRKDPFRKVSIGEKICLALEKRMATMRRKEDLTPFVEWVLDLYCEGYLIESEAYRAAMVAGTSRTVHKVGPIQAIPEEDEGQRKVS